MGFITDLRIVMTILGIVFTFWFIAERVSNKILGTLILAVALYYLLFYSTSLAYLIAFFAVLIFFHGLGYVQDIYFQMGSARELDMRAQAEQEHMVMTQYGPRWKE